MIEKYASYLAAVFQCLVPIPVPARVGPFCKEAIQIINAMINTKSGSKISSIALPVLPLIELLHKAFRQV